MSAANAKNASDKPEIFGVCRRLGDDFGFHPNILRIALAVGLVFSIEGVVAAYAAMGLIVLVSRLLAPEAKRAAVRQDAPAPVVTREAVRTPEFQQAA